MGKWISVKKYLPENKEYKKFHVKVNTGSISKKKSETIMLGKKTPTGFRFCVMDWQYVTHWKHYDEI